MFSNVVLRVAVAAIVVEQIILAVRHSALRTWRWRVADGVPVAAASQKRIGDQWLRLRVLAARYELLLGTVGANALCERPHRPNEITFALATSLATLFPSGHASVTVDHVCGHSMGMAEGSTLGDRCR